MVLEGFAVLPALHARRALIHDRGILARQSLYRQQLLTLFSGGAGSTCISAFVAIIVVMGARIDVPSGIGM